MIIEASAGDPQAAADRLAVLRTLPVVNAKPEAGQLAATLIGNPAIPAAESRDALHVAIAAVDYLLTWNCTLLANAQLAARIAETCVGFGVRPPVIATPKQLFNEAHHETPRPRRRVTQAGPTSRRSLATLPPSAPTCGSVPSRPAAE